jgi:diguanylate cyclase (GGDEF)-like protein
MDSVLTRLRPPTSGPARQAAALLVLSGLIGLPNCLVPGMSGYQHPVLLWGTLASLALGVATWLVPWDRWRPGATLTLVVPPALIIVVTARFGGMPEPTYGMWFLLLFAWVGMWHSPRAVLVVGPPLAVAYVAPYALGLKGATGDVASVTLVVPAGVVLGVALSRTVERMRAAQAAQQLATEALARASVTDELTGLGNRRAGNAMLEGLHAGDALLLLDLDHFKQVNDTFGHGEGDRLLAQLGAYLGGAVRGPDLVARVGGEEFMVIVRRSGDQGVEVAERLLRGWRLQSPLASFSVGVAVHETGQSSRTFGRADAALYEAKRQGRDRVSLAVGPPGLRVIDGHASA